MGFDRITTITLRPDRIVAFQEQVAELANAAAEKDEKWSWTAHQTLFGEGPTIHFASRAETFAEIEAQGQVEGLWLRAMGETRGLEAMMRAQDCIASMQQTVSIDRPDLSYSSGVASPEEYPYAAITLARARPGHFEGLEELIRKVAEAIPKTGESSKLLTYQVMFGQMGSYWTLRPLRSLAELDEQLPATELLNQAFGHAEGGLLWRSGSEAIEEARREVVVYHPELSNPPAS